MRRLLVNDALTQIPGTRTFWHDLQEWAGAEFIGGDYATLATVADSMAGDGGVSLIIRNATWFPPLKASEHVPTIGLLQDTIADGPQRKMQIDVANTSRVVVFNSEFCKSKYPTLPDGHVIPLPVDFSTFEPQNAMGCQQALGLPDGCVCWVGAAQGAAGHIKGWDIFIRVVRQNPDIPFVAVLKDAAPEVYPPNLRVYVRLTHEELVGVIGACRVGLCTSRSESQHLAGIEMGACGLQIVAPEVGVYWERDSMPGLTVNDPKHFTEAVRKALVAYIDPEAIRYYWRAEFDKPVIKAKWAALIKEVENAASAQAR
jgi:glycosyltransferase involved in cell wall biosynthesis